MTVPIYAEYKAAFNVVLVNIHLPFQHRQVVQTVRDCLIFVFIWARLHSALRAVGPNFALPAYITFVKLTSSIGVDLVVRMSNKYRIVNSMLLFVVVLLCFTAIKPWS